LRDFVRRWRGGRVVSSKEMTMNPIKTAAALALAAALATTAAPALACGERTAAPAQETITGVYPRLAWTFARWDLLTLSYPEQGGEITTYQGTFRVRHDARLVRFLDDPQHDGSRSVRVTLERSRGDEVWHLVAIAPLGDA
jgi:hypothetical protein